MNNTPVTVVATLKARPGQEAALRQALLALIPPTRQEPGCLNYDLHVAAEQPAVFMFHENWESKGDLDAHLQKPHLTAFLARANDLLAEPPQITLWQKIA